MTADTLTFQDSSTTTSADSVQSSTHTKQTVEPNPFLEGIDPVQTHPIAVQDDSGMLDHDWQLLTPQLGSLAQALMAARLVGTRPVPNPEEIFESTDDQ